MYVDGIVVVRGDLTGFDTLVLSLASTMLIGSASNVCEMKFEVHITVPKHSASILLYKSNHSTPENHLLDV